MIELHKNFKGVFGRIEFKEDEKLWRENGRKNIFEVCLVGWRGREKKKMVRPAYFLLDSIKKFSPKMGRKLEGRLFVAVHLG